MIVLNKHEDKQNISINSNIRLGNRVLVNTLWRLDPWHSWPYFF